jgi:hypothetical protein
MAEEMQVARPKGVPQQEPKFAQTVATAVITAAEKRGPGRPSIADPFDVLRQVAALLKTTDTNSRRMILETLRDLTE